VSQHPVSKITSLIPVFTSREEEAAWWDSHDLADYQDEFETVEGRFANNLSEGDAPRATQSASERS
jgi:hypothetical protein